MSKFYKTTCVSATGFRRQAVREVSFVPDNNLSETEDANVPVEDELALFDQEKNFIDEMFEDVVDEIETSDSDTSESSYHEEDDNTDYDELGDVPVERKTQSGNKNEKNKNEVKWKKCNPEEVNAQFNGPSFPDPPENYLDPKKYFDMFFNNEQTDQLVFSANFWKEYTNQYSRNGTISWYNGPNGNRKIPHIQDVLVSRNKNSVNCRCYEHKSA